MIEVTVLLKPRALAALLAIALAAAACGSGTDAPTAAPATFEPGAHLFPEVDVVRLDGEQSVNLAAELADGETAVLLWFWAPH